MIFDILKSVRNYILIIFISFFIIHFFINISIIMDNDRFDLLFMGISLIMIFASIHFKNKNAIKYKISGTLFYFVFFFEWIFLFALQTRILDILPADWVNINVSDEKFIGVIFMPIITFGLYIIIDFIYFITSLLYKNSQNVKNYGKSNSKTALKKKK